MNLIKFPLITGDDFVINSEIVLDASKLIEINAVGATCVATFGAGSANSILTWTFDGASAGAKLVNATGMLNLIAETCATLAGPAGNSKGVFDFCPEPKTAAGKALFEARAGGVIDGTATIGTIIVSSALS
tara:strand:+ start:126 stop:518 length:393 start_codon:yes stop_codon:yes gene_type:complete